MNVKQIAFVVALLMSFPTITQATQSGDTMDVTFQGHFLLSAPCTISSDDVIEIAFGNVDVNKVDGVNYVQPIPWTIDCHGAPADAALKLKISGTVTPFENTALTTSVTGLGIQILANGQGMKINEPLETTLSEAQSIALTAVPVKDPLTTLTTQAFSAVATLTAEYQ
ncbi:TPA: fimbrial protein [Citrobacter farmeri]|uniref:fimbrial protein n=1 Tax=Citrobacter farmeri TaxID=67824 RepID=UPI00388E3A7C|nr:fimbrial protein [Citrobacter farmeri]